MKKPLLKYGAAILIGAALAAVYVSARDFAGASTMERYRILCDAFAIPGVVLMLSAALCALANAGSFTALGYSGRYLLDRLIPGPGKTPERYGDYVERRREKKIRGYGFLLHVGAAFFAAALVFYFLFYRLY